MLQSDLTLDISALRLDAVPEVTKQFNNEVIKITSTGARWYEVGAAKYREMREAGQTALPAPIMLDGTHIEIPSREAGRSIPCRMMKPDGDVPIKGVLLHIHGGGWVLSMYGPTLTPALVEEQHKLSYRVPGVKSPTRRFLVVSSYISLIHILPHTIVYTLILTRGFSSEREAVGLHRYLGGTCA